MARISDKLLSEEDFWCLDYFLGIVHTISSRHTDHRLDTIVYLLNDIVNDQSILKKLEEYRQRHE